MCFTTSPQLLKYSTRTICGAFSGWGSGSGLSSFTTATSIRGQNTFTKKPPNNIPRTTPSSECAITSLPSARDGLIRGHHCFADLANRCSLIRARRSVLHEHACEREASFADRLALRKLIGCWGVVREPILQLCFGHRLVPFGLKPRSTARVLPGYRRRGGILRCYAVLNLAYSPPRFSLKVSGCTLGFTSSSLKSPFARISPFGRIVISTSSQPSSLSKSASSCSILVLGCGFGSIDAPPCVRFDLHASIIPQLDHTKIFHASDRDNRPQLTEAPQLNDPHRDGCFALLFGIVVRSINARGEYPDVPALMEPVAYAKNHHSNCSANVLWSTPAVVLY